MTKCYRASQNQSDKKHVAIPPDGSNPFCIPSLPLVPSVSDDLQGGLI